MKRNLIYHSHAETSSDYTLTSKITINRHEYVCQLDRISGDGITIRCDQRTLESILPNKSFSDNKTATLLNAEFSLTRKIASVCKVSLTRRLSKDQFIAELKFVEIDEAGLSDISEFVHSHISGERHPDKDVSCVERSTKKDLPTQLETYRLSKVA